VTDNDEAPNGERSHGAARLALIALALSALGMLAGAAWSLR
jgi:hypothetical protein